MISNVVKSLRILSIFLLLFDVLECATHQAKKLFLSLHWWTSLTLFINPPYINGFMPNFRWWFYFMNAWLSCIGSQRVIPLNLRSLWKIMLRDLWCWICYHWNVHWILWINNMLLILRSSILFVGSEYYLRHSTLIDMKFQIRDWLSLLFLWERLLNDLLDNRLLMLFLDLVWIYFNAWFFTWFSW